MSESELPPPSAALSVVKLMVLVWFLSRPRSERGKILAIMRWVARVFLGPEDKWPVDFGRPIGQAVPTINFNRAAARWIARYADLLEKLAPKL